jgi:hypothetical protein
LFRSKNFEIQAEYQLWYFCLVEFFFVEFFFFLFKSGLDLAE